MGVLREAPLEFVAAADVPCGGVLLALPALLLEGLLRHSREHFTPPPGYYPLETLFLVLAFMALARLRTVEALRYEPPGEWGKLVGLDRIPEAKTLRQKIADLCATPEPVAEWSQTLARDWIGALDADCTGVYYIDGHVRVYHGELTKLPRRYVSRERLCLRGTTDYWVNGLGGQPFFVVTRPIDPGLGTVLREQIVPRLLALIPVDPVAAAIPVDAIAPVDAEPAATPAPAPAAGAPAPASMPPPPRLTIVFDREGYSPALFAELKALGVAILTYHKFPGADWPEAEFAPRTVTLHHGETVVMSLAERGTCLPNGLWLREVRHREAHGHQVSILSTDYHIELPPIAVRMFARWCQENFFKYMREHYSLDRLVEHGVETLPETTVVINPAWRRLDTQVRRARELLRRAQAQLGAGSLTATPAPSEVEAWQVRQGELTARIGQERTRLEELKTQRKATPPKLELGALPKEEQFGRLPQTRKHFVDTIRLVAYRAETAMAHLAREKLARDDDARALLREIYTGTADLRPDAEAKTLTVRIHPLACRAHDMVLEHLCAELTATETLYPGTDLRLIYQLAGSS
jgi:hypothetical protein